MDGPRYYIDSRPATVLGITSTGFMTVVYDDRSFKDNIQVGEAHDWQPCELSKVDIENARARSTAAALGFKL